MEKNLRQTIKQITKEHLKKYKSFVFGQNLTGVGWVDNTLPRLYEKDGVIELPMADIADGGIVTGAALMNRKPIYIIRYQGYNWLNMIFITNYACKAYDIWKKPCPMFIRGIASEGSIGPVAGSSHVSIFYKMPGIKIFSPMTSSEYKKIYKEFTNSKEVYYISEHRESYKHNLMLKNSMPKNPDIVWMPISVTRFEVEKVLDYFKDKKIKIGVLHLVNLKPFRFTKKELTYLKSVKKKILITDNDYEDGLIAILSNKVTKFSGKFVELLGLKDKTAGHHPKVDNLPPKALDIISKINQIIKVK